MKRIYPKLMMAAGIGLVLISAIRLLYQESKLPRPKQLVIVDGGGDALVGRYYPGDVEAGVILAEGFGSDQVALRSIAEAFVRSGYHVLTFDFSGHGRSPGGLKFNNAQTDRLAKQLLAAKEIFSSRTGLENRRVLIVGHSLGARVALQAAVLDEGLAGGLILLGPQVNLITSVQAEVFTGVRDPDLPWVNSLGPETPRVNILLISSELDDILPPQAAGLLYQKISGKLIAEKNQSGELKQYTWRKIQLVENVLHNYEIYSRRVIQIALDGAAEMIGVAGPPGTAALSQTRYLSWGGAILGLFLLVGGANLSLPEIVTENMPNGLVFETAGRFFRTKLLLWLLALIPGALLGGLIFLLPLGNPAYNLVYISFLGGYGLVLLIFYRFNWMVGIKGGLQWNLSGSNRGRNILTAVLFILLLVVTSLFARSGWFYVLPFNHRLVWAVIFTPITALGFWIGWQENGAILQRAKNQGLILAANTLIGLLPFFLYAGFLGAIGSLSGVVGQLQGLLILLFSINCGIFFQKLGGNIVLTSLYQSFLIYWLILAQGVLFS